MHFLTRLKKTYEDQKISEKVYERSIQLFETYSKSVLSADMNMEQFHPLFESLLLYVEEQSKHPYQFEPYHRKITQPVDYYRFGIEFLRPLVDIKKSRIAHIENIEKMIKQLKAKENVILFANHQTEIDPQLISVVLEEKYADFASEMIFVAGDRVLTDPMAIPFSMGRNLLCIYSKRHINNPPEKKEEKLLHNQRTMKRMRELLEEGGKCIYVAPSGGRDRPNAEGDVVVSSFDPQSIEMFRLMAKQAKKETHFYPLSLVTYDILPPPQSIGNEPGEERKAKREGVKFSFGDEIDMESTDSELNDRHARRIARAMSIWDVVKTNYNKLKENHL